MPSDSLAAFIFFLAAHPALNRNVSEAVVQLLSDESQDALRQLCKCLWLIAQTPERTAQGKAV